MSRLYFASLLSLSLILAACTLSTPSEPTVQPIPTTPPATTVDDAPVTTTLRPTPTTAPTATALGGSIATPITLQAGGSTSSTGGGGTGFGSVNTGATGNTGGGSAPVGIRETNTPAPVGQPQVTLPSIPPTTQGNPTPTLTPPTQVSARYKATTNANSTLSVNYTIEATGGEVIIWVIAPDGSVIWIERFTETVEDTAEIPAPLTGDYEILAYAKALRGNFSLSYGSK